MNRLFRSLVEVAVGLLLATPMVFVLAIMCKVWWSTIQWVWGLW